MVRSKEKARGLSADVAPVFGSMADLDVLRRATEDVEGIFHTAFGLDMSRIVE